MNEVDLVVMGSPTHRMNLPEAVRPVLEAQSLIAISTLRTHAKSIYGKLDVHSRREAVARAQELGLL